MKAAQRIREYNQKKLLNQKNKKQTLPAFQFGAQNVTKPYNGAQYYQKPRPELIQPKLPRIAPYFH